MKLTSLIEPFALNHEFIYIVTVCYLWCLRMAKRDNENLNGGLDDASPPEIKHMVHLYFLFHFAKFFIPSLSERMKHQHQKRCAATSFLPVARFLGKGVPPCSRLDNKQNV